MITVYENQQPLFSKGNLHAVHSNKWGFKKGGMMYIRSIYNEP